MLKTDDVRDITCPNDKGGTRCGGGLAFKGVGVRDAAQEGWLDCARCGARWDVRDGLARLYREAEVRGNDKLMRYFYDALPALHDPAVKLLIPLFQTEGTEDALRDAYMRRIDLASLTPREDGRPLRILEVGAGTGANLARVRRDLPPHLAVELWALDLSEGMLGQLRRRLAREQRGEDYVRVLMADAHALPFDDTSFDRVFHVGGVGGYRDPARALAEMARVARRGTPIVVVDEQLDPARAHSLYHRLMFRAVTFYDPRPHSPREHVPPGALEVIDEQASRFFYCLTFRMPADEGADLAR
jgi:ubiquinone/menaquinone biosynthesis C-methylase UbiE